MAKQELKDHPYYAIRDLVIKLRKYPSAQLDPEDLKRLGVEITSMDVETGISSDGRLQFSKPFSRASFEDLLRHHKDDISWEDWGGKRENMPVIDESEPESRRSDAYDLATDTEYMLEELLYIKPQLNRSSAYGHRSEMEDPYETLEWSSNTSRERWQVHGMLEARDSSKPHMTCLVFDSTLPLEDRLRRSELYCAFSPMAGRFRDRRFTWNHSIVPMTVCSLAGQQARVIQTIYDPIRRRFVVRKSRIFTVKQVIDDNSKLLLRWMMNEPCGNTLADPGTRKPEHNR